MTRVSHVLLVVFALSPVAAVAQAVSSPPPLIVERIHTPVVVAPEFKVSDVDGRRGRLAGGYLGLNYDEALLVGGAGYWLTNAGRGEEFAYGGLLVGWVTPPVAGVRIGARGLIGGGRATLGREVTLSRPIRDPRLPPVPAGTARATFRVLERDDFFVFEPQANVAASLLPHTALNLAGGYRLTGMTDALDDRLNGATASVALQFQW